MYVSLKTLEVREMGSLLTVCMYVCLCVGKCIRVCMHVGMYVYYTGDLQSKHTFMSLSSRDFGCLVAYMYTRSYMYTRTHTTVVTHSQSRHS